MPRILVIKTSSLGDLVHCQTALQEAHWNEPELVVDWVSEEGFAAIPKSCAWVDRVHPVALRRWRKSLLSRETRVEVRLALDALAERSYDLVIDAQGLLKSAWLVSRARVPKGGRWGFDWSSAREPLASLVLDHKVHSPPNDHAV
ncbi:MAG: lipopolysaccharide heptosyltransferase 1, partial [Proteobacteria bacterium]|nr:lipopolysaccharide heptosyltransferase 1 [Pseudomonadota bacterium]